MGGVALLLGEEAAGRGHHQPEVAGGRLVHARDIGIRCRAEEIVCHELDDQGNHNFNDQCSRLLQSIALYMERHKL